MKISHLWADLAVDSKVLTDEVAREVVGQYWQALQAGMVFTFAEWVRDHPSVDAKSCQTLEHLFNQAEIRCLNCAWQGHGAELDFANAGNDDLRCPHCQSNSLKRERDRDASSSSHPLAQLSAATPPARALPMSIAEGYGTSEPKPPSSPRRESTKRQRIERSHLEQVTTRRLAPPVGLTRETPAESSAKKSTETSLPGDVNRPRTPTENLYNLRQIGNWILEEVIGQGGIGAVFRARHRVLRRMAAIKVLKSPSENLRKRFEREAQVYSDLDHPSVVRLFDYGEEDGQPYLVMEWVEGRTLTALVETSGPLSLKEAVAIAQQACDALVLAHDLGIIHRDIKPDNLMLTSQMRLKITDFGIAHVEDSRLTVQGAFLGTPHYMAPEQFKQEKITAAADWYGLGATLVFLLTGRPPFEESTATRSNAYKLLTSKATEKLPSLRKERTDISVALDEFLGSLCTPNPDDRPSGSEVSAALRDFAEEAESPAQQ